MNKQKSNKGITLIALVITIVILLILAVVSIRLVMNDGIITKAQKATTEYQNAEEEEQIKLAYADYQMQKAQGETNPTLTVKGATTETITEGWTITFNKTGNKYTLLSDGSTFAGNELYAEVEDDFWVIDSTGCLTINAEYLTPVTYNGNYTSCANAAVKVENVYECPYTRLIIPSSVNGTKVTKIKETMPNLINVSYAKIESGITELGFQAFARWTSLKSIEIPNTVTVIGKGAFAGCSSLDNVEIPNSVTDIYGYAFYYCTSLKNITIPNSVKNIGSENIWSFGGSFGGSYKAYPANVFGYCTSLKNIYIPKSVTKIANKDNDTTTFQGCSNDLVIYCGAASQQSGWVSGWNNNGSVDLTVNYGITREAYNEAIAK